MRALLLLVVPALLAGCGSSGSGGTTLTVFAASSLKGTFTQLGKDFDMRHFSPRYKPWDERVCCVPDGDLFKALRKGKAKLTLDRVGYFCHPDWVVSKGGRVPVGLWRPRIETREGLKATAQWYRAEGWL